MMDQLIECKHCGSNACYKQQVSEEVHTYMCFGCGFTTSTMMTEGSSADKSATESSPELYKGLRFVDDDKLAWYPATITLPNKGMVFVDGTTEKDWKWAAVCAVPLEKDDKKLSKDQTHKMDMKNVKHFAQRDYMDALQVIGFYDM